MTNKLPVVASKDFMEGYDAGWNDFGFKKDYRLSVVASKDFMEGRY